MDLYSKPIDSITFSDIEAFLENDLPESETLDYKRTLTKDLVNLMAAFANTRGGIILIGVDENKDSKPKLPACCIDVSKGTDDMQRRIESKAYDGVYPPLFPEVKACPKDSNPDEGVVLVRIAESHETPHFTDQRQKVYVRVKSQNRFGVEFGIDQAKMDQLEWLWNRRKKAELHREQLLRDGAARFRLMESYIGTEPTDHDAVIEAYAVPNYPDYRRTDPASLEEFAESTEVSDSFQGSVGFPLFPRNLKRLADGIAILAGRQDSRTRHYVQIDRWGSVQSLLRVSTVSADQESGTESPPRPVFRPTAAIYHVDAFLGYLAELYSAIESFNQKPLLLNAQIKFPVLHYAYNGQRGGNIGDPFLDTRIELIQDVLLPREIQQLRSKLTLDCAHRIYWASGYSFARDREMVEQHLRSEGWRG